MTIEDLAVPFACVATNFYTGQEVIINRGDLVTAVRASISIPGVFRPVAVDGMLLLDGGVVNPVPVQVVRDLGAEFIIAVDISPEVAKKITIQRPITDPGRAGGKAKNDEIELPNIFEIIMGSIAIMESQIVGMRMKTESPDIIVKPAVDDIGTYDFHRYQEGVQRGKSAADPVIPKISRYIRMLTNLPTDMSQTRPADGTLT